MESLKCFLVLFELRLIDPISPLEMYGCVESSWSIVLAVGPGWGWWNVRIMRRRCLQYSADEKWWNMVNCQWTPMFGSGFPLLLVFRPCHQKETQHSHISQNYQELEVPRNGEPVVWTQNFSLCLPSSQAIGLANISKCDALRVPGGNNWTNTTVIEAWTAQGKGEACCEWMERNNMKSTTRSPKNWFECHYISNHFRSY